MSDTAERFWSKVEKAGPDECWMWTGAVSHSNGIFRGEGHFVVPHKWAWEEANGPVPDGDRLRHTCRNGLCVNPAHLILSSAFCVRGHARTEANRYEYHDRKRNVTNIRCRPCDNIRQRESAQRKRAAAAS